MRKRTLSVTCLRQGGVFPNFGTSITLVQSNGQTVLVDPGYIADEHRLLQGLRTVGLTPDQVDVVVCTHSHLDHLGNCLHFPSHKVLIHRRELAEMELLQAMAREPSALAASLRAQYGMGERQARACVHIVLNGQHVLRRLTDGSPGSAAGLRMVEGSREVADGVLLLESFGHTAGHLSVLVQDSQWGTVLVAGDALATVADLHGGPVPMLTSDAAQYRTTRERLLAMEWDVLIAGHGAPCRRDGSPVLSR